jgi:DNA replicative helicase MCM subunit Mcm2 (Cdc46/Mcm family)
VVPAATLTAVPTLPPAASPPCSAYFQCQKCGQGVDAEVAQSRIDEPQVCPAAGCGAKLAMSRIDNRGAYADKQAIKVQVRI